MHSYYNMQAINGQKIIDQTNTGLSYHERDSQSVPAGHKSGTRFKVKNQEFAGMTKEQVRKLKKEKKQRRDWNKYKEKLEKERAEVAKQFKSSYYWHSYVISHGKKEKAEGGVAKSSAISPKNATQTSGMHLMGPKYDNLPSTKNISGIDVNDNVSPLIDSQGTTMNRIHLQQMITDSCTFYEHMEKQKEGSIERMLTDIRTKIDKGKVKVEKRDQYDPKR